MKTPILIGLALLVSGPLAYGGEPVYERTHGPCFKVTIQADAVNESNVQQNCDQNFNRTVQAGKQNRAQTVQTGEVNDNKVRQYDYSQYLDRKRADRRHGN